MLRATLHETEIRRAIGLPEEGGRVVDGLAPLDKEEDRCLYFVNSPITPAIREMLAVRRDCLVIAPKGSGASDLGNCIVIETDNPRFAIARVLEFIAANRRQQPWVRDHNVAASAVISSLALVHENVRIGEGVVIEPFCVVDADVSIGRGSILRSGVRVYSRVAIGEESVVGSNTVIGHQGYGFVRDEVGNKQRIPHLGGVVIGSHVEIGALVTIPSGTIGPTSIEDRAKIDDHVHVGHNVLVSSGASVTAAVIIGGSAVIGQEAWIGVNSSIRDGRRVGEHSLIGMDVSLQHDLPDNGVARAPRPDVQTRTDDDSASIGFA